MWAGYLRLLNTRPYLTKSVTASGIMMGGDYICQTIESEQRKERMAEQLKQFPQLAAEIHRRLQESDHYDAERTMRMGAFGLVFVGPLFHNWFNLLERMVPRQDVTGALMKVAIDQTVMAPFFCTSFFAGMGFMEGAKYEDVKEKLDKQLYPTLMTNYKIWPAAQMANFFLVPVNLRVLAINTVGLGFNAYLSMMNNQSNVEREVAELEAMRNALPQTPSAPPAAADLQAQR